MMTSLRCLTVLCCVLCLARPAQSQNTGGLPGTDHVGHRPWATITLYQAGCAMVSRVAAPFALALASAPQAVPHVRALDRDAAVLLERGPVRSPTINALIQTLERSDLFVWVETRDQPLRGQTFLLGSSSQGRYLRIVLRRGDIEDRGLPVLGHELQHAVEIASERRVTNKTALIEFYSRVGYSHADLLCTREAEAVFKRVAEELAGERLSRR